MADDYNITDEQDPYDGTENSVLWHLRAHLKSTPGDADTSSREKVVTRVVQLMVAGIVTEAARRGEPKAAYSMVTDAADLVDSMRWCLHFDEEKRAKRRHLWNHIPDAVGGVPGEHKTRNGFDKGEFGGQVADYLARPWLRCDHLDWVIVDALVWLERASFANDREGQNIVSLAASPAFWVVTIALWILMVWGLWSGVSYLKRNESPWLEWGETAAILFLCYQVFVIASGNIVRVRASRRGKAQLGKLLLAMHHAYGELDGAVLSPTRVRDALRAAETEGAVWEKVIWPVIDSACVRDANVWHVRIK